MEPVRSTPTPEDSSKNLFSKLKKALKISTKSRTAQQEPAPVVPTLEGLETLNQQGRRMRELAVESVILGRDSDSLDEKSAHDAVEEIPARYPSTDSCSTSSSARSPSDRPQPKQ